MKKMKLQIDNLGYVSQVVFASDGVVSTLFMTYDIDEATEMDQLTFKLCEEYLKENGYERTED